jgi:hypothetical protein
VPSTPIAVPLGLLPLLSLWLAPDPTRGYRNALFSKHSMKEAKFKLEALEIKNSQSVKVAEVDDLCRQTRINFDSFVKQSADTIKTLKFDVSFCDDISLAINKLQALECLGLDDFFGTDIFVEDNSKLPLEPDANIKRFECYSIDNIPKEIDFLKCLTNLKVLTITHIHKLDFEWIVRTMTSLKQL